MMSRLHAATAAPSKRRTTNGKLFYRIREVAEMTGLKPYVLRYWESEFSELSPEKDAADQRRYREKDINTVLAIRKLLYEDGFTIRGARQKIKAELRTHSKPANPKATARKSNGRTNARSPKLSRTMAEKLLNLHTEVDDLLKILGA